LAGCQSNSHGEEKKENGNRPAINFGLKVALRRLRYFRRKTTCKGLALRAWTETNHV